VGVGEEGEEGIAVVVADAVVVTYVWRGRVHACVQNRKSHKRIANRGSFQPGSKEVKYEIW